MGKRWWTAFLGVLVATSLLLGGVALAEDPAEEAPPEAAKEAPKASKDKVSSKDYSHLSGTWHSEWGDVVFNIKGAKFTGSWKDGTFTGYIDDNGIMFYDWEQEKGPGGKGTFAINKGKDGKITLLGRFGYGASSGNGGDWTCYK